MREVIRRRFEEYRAADKPEGFGRLPTSFCSTAAKGTWAPYVPLLREMGIDVPVYGMVKDDKHRTPPSRRTAAKSPFSLPARCSRWCRAFRTRCTALPSATTANSAKGDHLHHAHVHSGHRRNARQSADEALYNHTRRQRGDGGNAGGNARHERPCRPRRLPLFPQRRKRRGITLFLRIFRRFSAKTAQKRLTYFYSNEIIT